jgi:hypothetical protein
MQGKARIARLRVTFSPLADPSSMWLFFSRSGHVCEVLCEPALAGLESNLTLEASRTLKD